MIRAMRRTPGRATAAIVLILSLCLSRGATVEASSTAEAQTAPVTSSRQFQELQEQISGIFRAQNGDGSYTFSPADSLLSQYPIVATLSLEIHRNTGDLSFTSQARASIAKYFKFLLTEKDRDGDFLVERAAAPDDQINQGRIEDAGYNSMLALDLISLSQICIELKLPIEALFWREEANLIAKRTIDVTYDSEARFFFPYDNRTQTRKRYFDSASFMPTFFDSFTGTNISRAAIRHYLLRPGYLHPEVPFDYLTWRDIPGSTPGTVSSERLLKSMLLQLTLYHNGFFDMERRYQAQTAARIDSFHTQGAVLTGEPYASVLAHLLETGSYRTLYPGYNSLDLLGELVYAFRTLDDPEILRLRKSIETIERDLPPAWQEIPGHAPDSLATVGLRADIRTIYLIVSRLREQVEAPSTSSPWCEAEYFGADFPRAVERLLDDVVSDVRRVENSLFEFENHASGLKVSCTLPKERVVSGQNLSFNIAVTTDTQPVWIKSITADIDAHRELLFRSDQPTRIVPGDSILVFRYDVPMRPGIAGGIIPIPVSIEIETGSGPACRYSTCLGAVLQKTIDFSVNYPHGRILRNRELPIVIAMRKNAPSRITVDAAFFSPSGLRIREGQQTSLFMEQSQDSALLTLHVIPPQPCRPGAFSLALKLFADSEDLGLVTTSFFKHYQWIFAGPFELGSDAINKRFLPEQRINLHDRFSSEGETFTWKDLPEQAYAPNGEILLENLMSAGGVGYLHTVIASAADQDCSLFLSSNAPTLLFLNGKNVLHIQGTETLSPERTEVRLREGPNEILLKTMSNSSPKLYFKLGDEETMASDEFNNNLLELVEGYREFHKQTKEVPMEPEEFRRLVSLSYIDPDAHAVAVIGSFNGWSPEHSNLQKSKNNRWEITLNLAPGKYTYRFLVNNHKHILDPMCSYQESDGYGGKNSVLFIE